MVITGAIEKTYTPSEVTAVKIGGDTSILVNESDVCGVALQFPSDLALGAHPMGDPIKRLGEVVAFGDYNASTCPEAASLGGGTFRSTSGTLTLTGNGGKFSGTFDFTAEKLSDASKTIRAVGSFTDVSF